jgi:hypothetical protein
MTPRILRRGSRFPQDFPRKSEARAHHPPPAPLRPGACSTEACDPLNPRACPSEAYPGELMPGNIPDHSPIHTKVICVRIRLALNSLMKWLPRSIPLLASLPAIPCLFPAFLFVPPVRLASPAVRPVRQPLRFRSLIRFLDRTLFP